MKALISCFLLLASAQAQMMGPGAVVGVARYPKPAGSVASAGGGGGGIVFDVLSSSTATDPSITHPQGSLTSGYVLIIAGYTFSAATSGATATYDGTSATEIATFSQASFYHIKIFYRDLGTLGSGNKTATVSHTDAITSALTTVLTYSGVKQGGGFTVGQNGAFADPQSLPLATTSASELVVGGILVNATAANTTPDGTQYNEDGSAGVTYNNQWKPGTGSTVTLNWDLDAATHAAYVGVVMQPAP